MTSRELIYICVGAVLFLYSVGLTIALVVIQKRMHQTQNELGNRLQKVNNDIQQADLKIDREIAELDKQIEDVQNSTEQKIKTMGEELLSDTALLIEQRTSAVVDKMNIITNQLNIMDSTVKNLEREKFFVQGVITGSIEEQSLEADYTEVSQGFISGAKQAMTNAAKAGKNLVADYYPIIKKGAPVIAKMAAGLIKRKKHNKDS